jgi:hypothetical protein
MKVELILRYTRNLECGSEVSVHGIQELVDEFTFGDVQYSGIGEHAVRAVSVEFKHLDSDRISEISLLHRVDTRHLQRCTGTEKSDAQNDDDSGLVNQPFQSKTRKPDCG